MFLNVAKSRNIVWDQRISLPSKSKLQDIVIPARDGKYFSIGNDEFNHHRTWAIVTQWGNRNKFIQWWNYLCLSMLNPHYIYLLVPAYWLQWQSDSKREKIVHLSIIFLNIWPFEVRKDSIVYKYKKVVLLSKCPFLVKNGKIFFH